MCEVTSVCDVCEVTSVCHASPEKSIFILLSCWDRPTAAFSVSGQVSGEWLANLGVYSNKQVSDVTAPHPVTSSPAQPLTSLQLKAILWLMRSEQNEQCAGDTCRNLHWETENRVSSFT